MIQSALLFLLGFLCAAFLVLLATPVVWRRAHYLWRRQMATQMPVSLIAIEADRDLLRANHAAQLAKAHMQIRILQEKQAKSLIQIGADREEQKKIPLLEQRLAETLRKQAMISGHLTSQQQELTAMHRQAQEANDETNRLNRQSQALSQLADTLRLELVGRETEIDRLRREAQDMRQERKQQVANQTELASRNAALKTELQTELARNHILEEKLHKLISELSDTQEKLERRNKQQQSSHDDAPHSAEQSRISTYDRHLRETISDMAAEMVVQTAAQEGEKSPIHQILQQDQSAQIPEKTDSGKSLAQRINKLTV